MIENTDLLNYLFSENRIKCKKTGIFSKDPAPLPKDFDFDRIEGMLLGLAIGDSLGNTTESLLPEDRRDRFGVIKDYLPNQYANNRTVGLPSDDTQMAFWTLEELIKDGGLVPDHLAKKFCSQQIFGIGSTVRDFIRAYREEGKPWHEAGQPSAGNGALMRIAPILLPHLKKPSKALWADTVLASMVTHNEPASIACCVGFVHLLWGCLRVPKPSDVYGWIFNWNNGAESIDENAYYSSQNPSLPYHGTLSRFVFESTLKSAKEGQLLIQDSVDWYSGAYLLETMPTVLNILSLIGNDPEQAILQAVNNTKDNDTIAAIVGAAIGAVHGRSGLPKRWIENLLGRTSHNDDWRIFELIEDAKQAFWQADSLPSQYQIHKILEFKDYFQDPNFKVGQWKDRIGQETKYSYNSLINQFLQALKGNNFIIPDFDWANWIEGNQLIDRPELLDVVGLQTIRKLLTTFVKKEKITEGFLAQIFENGLIVKILMRLKALEYSVS